MSNDARVKELTKKVAKKKKDLGSKPKHVLVTNGHFKFVSGIMETGTGRNGANLNTISTIEQVVEMMTVLVMHHNAHKQACKNLGVESEFTWSGYTVAQWLEDFKYIIAKINYTSEERKLKAVEKQLKTLLSEDAKTEMALDDIEDLL
jgi:hypothetical protein